MPPATRSTSDRFANGTYGLVSQFTGVYTEFPHQMFDRRIEPRNHIYLGLRAYNFAWAWKKEAAAKAL